MDFLIGCEECNTKWIPYEELQNIEHVACGGFGDVYKATWNEKTYAIKFPKDSKNVVNIVLAEVS